MNIGRYQLVEKLGQGGMGVVYRAFDTLLQRVVAVKVISGSIEAGPEQRERFLREARAAGQLSHRNIITIHDLGEHEGQPYLAMEYLEGEDLQRRLARRDHMSLARKVELAIEICEALEYAHARGVVHRDIKPANIFISSNGTARILDFGLARLVTSELTNSNMMMGTVNYMAPEQVRGERADFRSDIFSVGVVLYELLGGRKAFEGDSFASTMYQILHQAPEPLLRIDPSLPPELAAIVDRALAKPRDERYQSMSEMLRDLAVYRQKLIAYDSPAFGRPASGGEASPSNSPLTPPPSLPSSDAVTMLQNATPVPAAPVRPSSGAAQAPVPAADVAPPGSMLRSSRPPAALRRVIWIAAVVVVSAIGFAIWYARTPRPPAVQMSQTPATAAADQAAIATTVREAAQALESGDLARAQRDADRALSLAPDHPDARRIRERAATLAESVTRGLREARGHYEAGRFEEASRAAGEVLSLVPGEANARQLMQDAVSRSRGRGADEARRRMLQAKAAARAASAVDLAAAPYSAALGAERTAQRLYDAGQLVDATAKFYEASGLFRSAELAAQSEAAARAERAAGANAEKERAGKERVEKERVAPPARDVPPQPLPAPPVSRSLDPQGLGATSVPLPSPPATPAAAPPSPATSAPPEPPAESQIGDLIARYETALESRSLADLKRLWPGLSGSQESAIRDEFAHASRIQVEVSTPRIGVAGATATATFMRRYELLTTDGQRLNSRSVTTMTFRRTPAGWVIDQVRFDLQR